MPFRLESSPEWDKENVSVACPPLEAEATYDITFVLYISRVPKQWAVRPRDIRGFLSYDTVESSDQEETTPGHRTSEFGGGKRPLGLFMDGRQINHPDVAPDGKCWPWGVYTDTFHTTMGGAAGYTFGFDEDPGAGYPLPAWTPEENQQSIDAHESVEGIVYLILKRRDG